MESTGREDSDLRAGTAGRSLIWSVLRKALELVEDIAEVYGDQIATERRAYNQAFFECMWVEPEYEGGRSAPVAGIALRTGSAV